MTFDAIKKLGDWQPIEDCPGRYVLRGVTPTFSMADLVGDGAAIEQFQSPRARDMVFVVCLTDGGIISYRRATDTWTHTLCTTEGFRRKLEQLEITVSESVAKPGAANESVT